MPPKPSGYVAIVGRPNVGKSTLFNRLTRSQAAIVHDQPGVTRDRHYGVVTTGERTFHLIDTAGFEPWAGEGLSAQVKAQVETALDEADVVVFLLDGRAGLTPVDQEIAGLLRRRARPVLTTVNKVDRPEDLKFTSDFYALGLGDILPVSGAHGLGVEDLVEEILKLLPEPPEPAEGVEAEGEVIRVAVIGRPNVGKSSLINRICGEERLVVSEIPGTTRDAVDIAFRRAGRDYLFIDTAGLRRPGRVALGVEKFSVLRALKALDRADVAVVLVDSLEGLTDSEARIAGLAEERGRAVILGLNKWDLVEEPDKRLRQLKDAVDLRMKFLAFAPVLSLSALTGHNLGRLFKTIDRLFGQSSFRAATAEVNRVLEEAQRRHQPPLIGRRRLKFLYAAQVATKPPTFVVFANYPEEIHFSYARFLANQFKEAFNLTEIPVKVLFRRRKRGEGDQPEKA